MAGRPVHFCTYVGKEQSENNSTGDCMGRGCAKNKHTHTSTFWGRYVPDVYF